MVVQVCLLVERELILTREIDADHMVVITPKGNVEVENSHAIFVMRNGILTGTTVDSLMQNDEYYHMALPAAL